MDANDHNTTFPKLHIKAFNVFSAAAAILTAEIGDQISFTDSSKIDYGFPLRSYNNFNDYAKAAVSRLYGGIHYRFDNENGFNCGQLVAMNVEHLDW